MTKTELLKQLGWSDTLIAEFIDAAEPMRKVSQKTNLTLNSDELTYYSTTNSIFVVNENNISSEAFDKKAKKL